MRFELLRALAVLRLELGGFARFAIGLDDADELGLDVRPNYYVPEVL